MPQGAVAMGAADGAFEYVANAEFAPDLAHIKGLALVRARRTRRWFDD
jgi:hypothetical protein